MIVLPALVGTLGGCADSHFASSNASMQTSSDTGRPQREAPVQVGYGMTSDGPTTDLYTEIFRPKRDDAPAAPAVAQGQPTAAAPATVAQGRPGARSPAAVAQNQAATAANVVPPAPAAPPAEPATPTAYGISSNGPTTDLYTELFGRNRQ